MNAIGQLFQNHPYVSTTLATWLFNNIVTALISNLPAPTKDSSQKYVYAFKVLNSVMGNVTRALGSHVESSPNFEDAVVKKVNGSAPKGADK